MPDIDTRSVGLDNLPSPSINTDENEATTDEEEPTQSDSDNVPKRGYGSYEETYGYKSDDGKTNYVTDEYDGYDNHYNFNNDGDYNKDTSEEEFDDLLSTTDEMSKDMANLTKILNLTNVSTFVKAVDQLVAQVGKLSGIVSNLAKVVKELRDETNTGYEGSGFGDSTMSPGMMTSTGSEGVTYSPTTRPTATEEEGSGSGSYTTPAPGTATSTGDDTDPVARRLVEMMDDIPVV